VDFALFVLINAILFLRPAELLPIGALPIYEVAIVSGLLSALPSLQWQLSLARLAYAPITICILGLLVAITLSLSMQGAVAAGCSAGFEFLKIVLYYLLLVSVVNSVDRLERFLTALQWMLVAVAVLPLLHQHGIANFAMPTAIQELGHDAEGRIVSFARMQSVGLDPNDLAMLVVTGMLLCIWKMSLTHHHLVRLVCVVQLAVLAYVLIKTQSRGGLLSLVSGCAVLSKARLGTRKTLLLALAAAPVALVLFGGRMTDFSALETGTGQSRVQLWSNGLAMLRSMPLFGVGYGGFLNFSTHVAHNSFIHCFAELGLFGGTLFLGAFVTAAGMLWRVAYADPAVHDPDATPSDIRLIQLRPYLFAIVVAYITGMMTLSRAYVVPTYTVLGLAAAWAQIAETRVELPGFCADGRFGREMITASALFLGGIYTFVRMFVSF
jgi:O-antigen ligase